MKITDMLQFPSKKKTTQQRDNQEIMMWSPECDIFTAYSFSPYIFNINFDHSKGNYNIVLLFNNIDFSAMMLKAYVSVPAGWM